MYVLTFEAGLMFLYLLLLYSALGSVSKLYVIVTFRGEGG